MNEEEFDDFMELVEDTDVLEGIENLTTEQQIIILANMSWMIEKKIDELK